MGIAARRCASWRHRDEGGRRADRCAGRWLAPVLGDDGPRGRCHRCRGPARGAGGRRRDGAVATGPHSRRSRAADLGGRRSGARRARAPASRGRRRDGSAPGRVGGCRPRDRRARRLGRVGASGSASPGGAGAEDPLAPCPSRDPVVQDSGRKCVVVRGRWPGHRRSGRRGCGAPREHGSSSARLVRAVGRGARERIGGRAGGRPDSPRVPWHRRCGGARVPTTGLPPSARHGSAGLERPACRPAGLGADLRGIVPRGGPRHSAHGAISPDPCSRPSRCRSIRPTGSGS